VTPLLAVDLGSRPAFAVVIGTERVPVLLEMRRFSAWRTEEITEAIAEVMERRGIRLVYVEQTFSAGTKRKPWLRDVGRKQEGQSGYLEGWLWGRGELRRVAPCGEHDAFIAWNVFGMPAEATGAAGEHLRDALAVGLKALIAQGMEAKEKSVREAR